MVPTEQYAGINSVIMKNIVSSDIKAAINAAFKFCGKRDLPRNEQMFIIINTRTACP